MVPFQKKKTERDRWQMLDVSEKYMHHTSSRNEKRKNWELDTITALSNYRPSNTKTLTYMHTQDAVPIHKNLMTIPIDEISSILKS